MAKKTLRPATPDDVQVGATVYYDDFACKVERVGASGKHTPIAYLKPMYGREMENATFPVYYTLLSVAT